MASLRQRVFQRGPDLFILRIPQQRFMQFIEALGPLAQPQKRHTVVDTDAGVLGIQLRRFAVLGKGSAQSPDFSAVAPSLFSLTASR